VIGPTFSGSAESLARTIQRWRKDRGGKLPEFWVCTGSATSVDKRTFETLAGKGVRFTATVIPDDVMFSRVIKWLWTRNHFLKSCNETVVLLTEAGTEYSYYINNNSNLTYKYYSSISHSTFLKFAGPGRRINATRSSPSSAAMCRSRSMRCPMRLTMYLL